MSTPHLRARYLQDSVSTASPAKLVIMLFDRLVLDLMHGEEAIRKGNRDQASEKVTHAQEIVLELRVTLDLETWDGAPGLANLYGFILTELIGANIRQDADRVAGCRKLLEPLRDAWREASTAAT